MTSGGSRAGGQRSDDRRVYERAGFGGRFELGSRPAVLVVDLMRGFTDPAATLGSELSDVVAATAELLAAARRAQLPVIFSRICYAPDMSDAGAWLQKVPSLRMLTEGSEWVELDPRLGRLPHEPVVTKRGASAFAFTDLAVLLNVHRADTVVVVGATTSGCVRATAVDSVQHGYPTVVVPECVGDRAAEPHEVSLFDLQSKYADVVALPEALSYVAACAPPASGVPA